MPEVLASHRQILVCSPVPLRPPPPRFPKISRNQLRTQKSRDANRRSYNTGDRQKQETISESHFHHQCMSALQKSIFFLGSMRIFRERGQKVTFRLLGSQPFFLSSRAFPVISVVQTRRLAFQNRLLSYAAPLRNARGFSYIFSFPV